MAAVVKSTKWGYDAISATKCINIAGLLGEQNQKFKAGDPVYIDSNGRLTPSLDDSTAVKFDGFAMSDCDSDGYQPCTVLGQGLIMEWLEDSDDYTPGTLLYVGAANQLETTGRTAVAMAITNKEVIVICPPGVRLGSA